MIFLKLFFCLFNNESSVVLASIIELTVYTLDGLILDKCVSKYGFVCMCF